MVVMKVVAWLALIAGVGCGDDAGGVRDAGPDDAPVDAQLGSLQLVGPSSFETYTCAHFTVSARDPATAPLTVSAPLPVAVGGLGGAVAFASLADCRANIAGTVSIAAGTSAADVYVRANVAATLALTASAPGFADANLAVTVAMFQVIGQADAISDAHNPLAVGHGTLVVANGKLIHADRDRGRVLIWNTLPTAAGQPPAIALGRSSTVSLTESDAPVTGAVLGAPTGVWSDGTRLVVSDVFNNRVLVWTTFPTVSGQPASFALGQPAGAANLTSSTANNGGISGATLDQPGAVWSDGTRLYVCDSQNHRVLVWTTFPTAGGQSASFALGQLDLATNAAGLGASTFDSPDGIVGSGTALFVSDTNNHRVLGWTALPTASGQAAAFALGQPNLVSNTLAAAAATTIADPRGLAIAGTRLFVADSTNHRVLAWSTLPTSNGAAASYVVGQLAMLGSQQNATGRNGAGLGRPIQVATDGTRFFISEWFNQRILAWPAVPTATGSSASFAIGQPTLSSIQDSERVAPTASLTGRIAAIASDGVRLFVVDNGHNRVLVWNTLPTSSSAPADFALGQAPGATNLTSSSDNAGQLEPTASTMSNPTGVYLDGTRLYVADSANSRVLVWTTLPTMGGQPADFALGQPAGVDNLTSNTSNNGGLSGSSMVGPTAIARHGMKLFVADSNNNRVLVWNAIPMAGGAPADFALGQAVGAANLTSDTLQDPPTAWSLYSPRALHVIGNQLFVADRFNNRVLVWNTIPMVGGAAADFVLGQVDFVSKDAALSASSIYAPTGFATMGTRLFISDQGANRILGWNTIPTASAPADTVFGQPNFTSRFPNQRSPQSGTTVHAPWGLFADGPRLLIADSENHRILIVPTYP